MDEDDVYEYLLIRITLTGASLGDDAAAEAVVSGIEGVQEASVYRQASTAYIVIHHGGLEPGTYSVTISGLKATLTATEEVRTVKPVSFTIIKK